MVISLRIFLLFSKNFCKNFIIYSIEKIKSFIDLLQTLMSLNESDRYSENVEEILLRKLERKITKKYL